MSDELKPCPFCGGKAVLIKPPLGMPYVCCDAMFCTGPKPNATSAVAAWNTRTDTIPSPDALIRAAMEEAARAVEPQYEEPSVDPSNPGDVAMLAQWQADMGSANLIRALAADPEARARIAKAAEGRG